MTVSDLIKQEIDIDVYDDVCEELCIAFVGPLELTEEGLKKFSDVLNYNVVINSDSYGGFSAAIVCVDGKEWNSKLRKAIEFFDAAAGYCPADCYDKWFKETEE